MIKALLSGAAALLAVCCLQTIGSAEEPGERLYAAHCGQCHGGQGRGGKAPRLVPFAWSDAQLLNQVRHPECDMPPIPATELSDAEVAQIAAYLRGIK